MTAEHPNQSPRRDPFLEEVHALKRAAWEEAGADIETLGQHLIELQERYADRLVQPPSDDHAEDAA